MKTSLRKIVNYGEKPDYLRKLCIPASYEKDIIELAQNRAVNAIAKRAYN